MFADARGQSSVVGTALVVAISVLAAVSTVGVAVVALDEARTGAREAGAVNTMAEFDSTASLVALGSQSESARVDLGSPGGGVTVEPGGRLVVEVVNPDTGAVEQTLLDRELGSVVYSVGRSDIAFEGGGVWRRTGDQPARVISQPEFHFRGRTLTVPLLTVDDGASPTSLSGSVQVTQATNFTAFPNATRGNTNPLDAERIRVRVESDYYEGWHTFFQERIGGETAIDHDAKTASVVLVTPSNETVNRGVAATAGSGFRIAGSGGSPSFVDSYDSDVGDYATTKAEGGVIAAAGDIVLRGDATVKGDAVVPPGYRVDANGNSEVTGEVRKEELNVTYPRGRVRNTVEDARSNNDNAGTNLIQNGRLQGSGTLTAGTYYLEELNLDSETLTLDTSSGNVVLAVDGDVSIGSGGTLEVAGTSGVARVYVNGDDFSMNGGQVTVPGDAAERFWLYGRPALQGQMRSGAQFTGVYYAPSKNGRSTFEMRSNSEVFGAVAAGEPSLRSGSRIHFDQALRDETAYTREATLVTYLHLSVNEVELED